MKKLSLMCLAAALMLSLCSCSVYKGVYKEREGLLFNYNNATASNYSGWFTEDTHCYYHDFFIFCNLHVDTPKGGRLVRPDSGRVQTVGDKLYIAEDGQNWDRIVQTDLYGNNSKTLCSEEEYYNEYLVLDDFLFTLGRQDYTGEPQSSLKKVSLTTKEVTEISDICCTFGVVNNTLIYVTWEQNICTVYSYHQNKSTFLGKFECVLDGYYLPIYKANFTTNYVVLKIDDLNRCSSKLLRYDYQQNVLEIKEFPFYIETLVAFDQYAFLSGIYDMDENSDDIKYIYHMRLDDFSIKEIDQMEGFVYLFVISENDAYIKSTESGLFHYKSDGTKEPVYKS